MALERYRQMRNFRVTPEPEGKVGRRRSRTLAFVIQKHAATRLHYDFRLELNGVLLSWAVPKGPSLDPNDKRLAVHVEDHPLEYGEFEGVIPPKQYGAGTVMVWDRGIWTPKTDPSEAYAKGHLKFELHGEKLHGIWNLVRSRGGRYGDGGKSWLLFKEADDHARLGVQAQIVDDRPDSVVSGRTLAEIATQADRVWHSNRSAAENVQSGAIRKRTSAAATALARLAGARKATMPDRIEAQLATSTKLPPGGSGWVHEVKYDGYRMLCRIVDGDATLVSRNARDWSAPFRPLTRTLARLPVASAWIDGEVVVVDAQGRSSFQALQNALSGTRAGALTYFAFDLLYLDGIDVRGVALTERKRILEELLASTPATLRYSPHFDVPGTAFLHNVRALGLEGMISKRADQPYRSGRGPAWQKIKCARQCEFVIGGYTDREGSRTGFGALLLGIYEADGRLTYCGKVGSGFDDALLESLGGSLGSIRRTSPPFHNPPQGAEGRRAHWVEPRLVANVSFTEWTRDATLRHPTFRGLRDDKAPADVVRTGEAAAEALDVAKPSAVVARSVTRASKGDVSIGGITLSNPEKTFYPEAGLAKRDLALYYAAVADWMLPHLRDRPLTLVRHPDGWEKKGFYQKNADDAMHAAISRIRIPGDEGADAVYTMANSAAALIALLQMGVLEIHPWGSRANTLGLADRLVFDLDPDEALPWKALTQSAQVVRTLLETIGLAAFLKTTGGKGLHVVVPIEPSANWDQVKGFTKAVAELLARTFPDRFTASLLKVSRRGRIFIDYLRNAEGATAVAAYSLRARASAPVSTPIRWDELAKDVRFAHFNARNVPKRLARLRGDPWEGIEERGAPLTPALMAKVGYKAR